ncbi:MAG TPA: hypothetical protein VFN49_07930, partial [Candidatus Aquilonibacter sp.]|nr:hypothetical protein [Candidatus Aquilonibacter sp.]
TESRDDRLVLRILGTGKYGFNDGYHFFGNEHELKVKRARDLDQSSCARIDLAELDCGVPRLREAREAGYRLLRQSTPIPRGAYSSNNV